MLFQLTAARRRLHTNIQGIDVEGWFQLTAARRRLRAKLPDHIVDFSVSTHSRSKAAASLLHVGCPH